VQYLSDDGRETVVLAWRAAPQHGQPEPALRLSGLDPAVRYVDAKTGAEHHGAVLLHHGLAVDLPPGDHASALVHLVRNGVSQP
jgi:alpha-galactosidase